ncbi:hypothetical protein [Acuticoccus sp.]|uniref:hypothetical protein n=1 Tax=Acuticoccus sp. TaxID=1904378 RepID=UPI003B519833
MASDVQKFTSKGFVANIDLDLMRALFVRHFADGDSPIASDGDPAEVRAALTAYFHAPVTDWSEGMIADLHRVKELGKESGLQLILGEARRQGVVLYSEAEQADDEPTTEYEPRTSRCTSTSTIRASSRPPPTSRRFVRRRLWPSFAVPIVTSTPS